MNIMQSMIFAAGFGTRLKPITNFKPKALVEVNGIPLLAHTINKLKSAGSELIVVNVHHFSNQIIDYINKNNFGVEIKISDETLKILDTGGGIKKAAHFFSPNIAILLHNVDILSNINLQQFYTLSKELIEKNISDAILLVSPRCTKRYLIFNKDMKLVGWTNVETGEVKSPYAKIRKLKFSQPYNNTLSNSNQHNYKLLAFSGIHVINPSIIKKMDDSSDVFPIMDFYISHCDELNFTGYIESDLKLLDVGKLDTLEKAETFLHKYCK